MKDFQASENMLSKDIERVRETIIFAVREDRCIRKLLGGGFIGTNENSEGLDEYIVNSVSSSLLHHESTSLFVHN